MSQLRIAPEYSFAIACQFLRRRGLLSEGKEHFYTALATPTLSHIARRSAVDVDRHDAMETMT
jgi:hypothetical protein